MMPLPSRLSTYGWLLVGSARRTVLVTGKVERELLGVCERLGWKGKDTFCVGTAWEAEAQLVKY